MATVRTEDKKAPRLPDPPLDPASDDVGLFRPAIFVVRSATTAISAALAFEGMADGDLAITIGFVLVVADSVFRLIQPVRYTDDVASLVRVLAEVVLHVTVVVATGYWESPFGFALLTAVIVAGFARGFGFALRIGAASALAVTAPMLLLNEIDRDLILLAVQWSVELFLVALIAGYARRITGEVDRRHHLALDRLGRLADANLLLHSLHRVAQTLPASLDIEEVLDSTQGRLTDLFDYDGATIFLLDETDESWLVVRWDGPRPAPSYRTDELPAALRDAVRSREPVLIDRLSPERPGVAVEMASGIYAPLSARNSVVGLVALESQALHNFKLRDLELISGFVEPAALAIDNARWFSRLRTVGADEERTRIARDLHDRIGQSLAYLAFELDRIVKTDAKGDPVTKQLERLRSDVRGVIGEVRDTLYDLRTDVTDEHDVAEVLTGFLERVEARSPLTIRFNSSVTGRLPLMQERELWRVAQEAIANVERHSQAQNLVVTWRSDGARAVLIVADDGAGFADGRGGRMDSYGIIGMRERAASIGATLEIGSEPGRGTTVRCELRTV